MSLYARSIYVQWRLKEQFRRNFTETCEPSPVGIDAILDLVILEFLANWSSNSLRRC